MRGRCPCPEQSKAKAQRVWHPPGVGSGCSVVRSLQFLIWPRDHQTGGAQIDSMEPAVNTQIAIYWASGAWVHYLLWSVDIYDRDLQLKFVVRIKCLYRYGTNPIALFKVLSLNRLKCYCSYEIRRTYAQ